MFRDEALSLSTGQTDDTPRSPALSLRVRRIDLDIPPILDIVHILLSLFPSALDHYQAIGSSGDGIAGRARRFAINEELVRETMGDCHFRHLSEAMVNA